MGRGGPWASRRQRTGHRSFGSVRRGCGTAAAAILHTQGPVARKEFRLSLRFPRAENFAELLRRDSRKTGSGVRRIWARQCPSGAVPGGVLSNPSLLPAKPSEAGLPGRGGARERTQFSLSGGNGVEWTLRRRVAMGKVGRRPQAAKSPVFSLPPSPCFSPEPVLS